MLFFVLGPFDNEVYDRRTYGVDPDVSLYTYIHVWNKRLKYISK